MLDVTLFGTDPGIAHLHNAVLHGINSLLVYLVIFRFTNNHWQSLLLSLVFLVHPQHVESVAWIAERKDLLCALFFLWGLLVYDTYKTSPSIARYCLLVFCLVMALMAKSMAVTFPFLLIVLDHCIYRFRDSSAATPSSFWDFSYAFRNIPNKLLLIAISVVAMGVTLISQGAASFVSGLDTVSITDRLQNAVYGYTIYIRQFFVPADLAVYYPIRNDIPWIETIASGLLVAYILGVGVKSYVRQPLLTAGIAWYFLLLVPVIGLVQVGSQSHADRYMYLPSIGILLVLSALMSLWSNVRLKTTVASVFVVFFAVVGYFQVGYWENRHLLFNRALDVTDNNFIAHSRLVKDYLARGMIEQAKYHAFQTYKLVPDVPMSFVNFGIIAVKEKDYPEAERHFKQAIKVGGLEDAIWINLSLALAEQGKIEEALPYFQRAIDSENSLIAEEAKKNLARFTTKN